MRRRAEMAIAAVVVLTVLVTAGAFAAEGDVRMVGSLWLRVRCPSSGYSIAERADAIETRVNDLLVLGGFDLSTVQVKRVGADAIIYADGRLLATVNWCDARANHTTPMNLAKVWADKFREIYPQVVPVRPGPVEQPTPGG